jgi:hypothetical protein
VAVRLGGGVIAREFEAKAKEEEEEDESKRRGVSRSGGLEERGRARRDMLRRRGGVSCDILVMYVDRGAQGRSDPVLSERDDLHQGHLLFCRPPHPHHLLPLRPLHSRFH